MLKIYCLYLNKAHEQFKPIPDHICIAVYNSYYLPKGFAYEPITHIRLLGYAGSL